MPALPPPELLEPTEVPFNLWMRTGPEPHVASSAANRAAQNHGKAGDGFLDDSWLCRSVGGKECKDRVLIRDNLFLIRNSAILF